MTSGRGHLGGRRGGIIVRCGLSVVHSMSVSVRYDVVDMSCHDSRTRLKGNNNTLDTETKQ